MGRFPGRGSWSIIDFTQGASGYENSVALGMTQSLGNAKIVILHSVPLGYRCPNLLHACHALLLHLQVLLPPQNKTYSLYLLQLLHIGRKF